MAQMSHSTGQYRDGVFGGATPAPRYGSLTSVYENGSLGDDAQDGGDLETNAAAILDPALDKLVMALDPAGLESRALQPAALAAAQVAVSLAKLARVETDVQKKIIIAAAASYSAAFFGLPRNTLLYTIDQVCGMFAMTAYQRRDFHQQAARLLDSYVASLTKDNPMAGVFQAGASRDGSLGGAYRDGVLGAMLQNGSFQDGSLGRAMAQPGAFQDGALGVFMSDKYAAWLRRHNPAAFYNAKRKMQARPTSGLGGCGCSGMGADAATTVPATEIDSTQTPFYKKPVVIGAAAVALGVVLYAVSKR